jgi:hypothetical protein
MIINIHRKIESYLIVLVVILFTGCASSTGGIAVSNIPLEGSSYTFITTDQVLLTWYSIDFGLIGVPLAPPPVEEAQTRLLEKHGGDALVNLRYWSDRSIFLFMTRNRFSLKADIVRIERKKK